MLVLSAILIKGSNQTLGYFCGLLKPNSTCHLVFKGRLSYSRKITFVLAKASIALVVLFNERNSRAPGILLGYSGL